MTDQINITSNRIHPLVAVAAVAVIGVSLLGVAALTGVLPSSHGSVAPMADSSVAPLRAGAVAPVGASAGNRYLAADGQMLELVPVAPSYRDNSPSQVQPAAVPVRRKVVHHSAAPNPNRQQAPAQYAQSTYREPARVEQQPAYAPPQHPVQNYVSDMHPVGTGVGAVVGGLLGNQVGGGNGRKVATVAGVLLGGYAGNEVAHNRNPLPW